MKRVSFKKIAWLLICLPVAWAETTHSSLQNTVNSNLLDISEEGTNVTTVLDESIQESTGRVVTYKGYDILICNGFSCSGRCEIPRENLTVANCFCDEICSFYGDCCYDYFAECNHDEPVEAPWKVLTDQDPHCSHILQEEHALLVDRCHGNWSSGAGRQKCEEEDLDDVFSIMPVTHKKFHVAFKNIYCAVCNYLKADDLQYWEFNVSCTREDDLSVVTENGVSMKTLERLEKEGCHVRLRPHDPQMMDHVRFCNPHFVNACRSDPDLQCHQAFDMTQNLTTDRCSLTESCQSYASYVLMNGLGFSRYVAKNTHCALCINNYTSLENLACPTESELLLDFYITLKGIGLPPFSLLLDFNGYHWTLSRSTETPNADQCASNLYYHNGMCRDAICQFGLQRQDDMCFPARDSENILLEFIVSSPTPVAGIFQGILVSEALDHGVAVGNITAETQKTGIEDECKDVSTLTVPSRNFVDFDLTVPENSTSLVALLKYVDDLIIASSINLASVKISNAEFDVNNSTMCKPIENLTLLTNSTEAVLLSSDGTELNPDTIDWEIKWISECVLGRLKPTTNKTITACEKQKSSCFLVQLTEDELREINLTSDLTFFNDTAYVCSTLLKKTNPKTTSYNQNSDDIERILTAILLPISMLALVFTILTHCIIHRLKSLPGKIVLSLSLALLLAQVLFLTLEAAVSVPWLCQTVAILEHFLWISTFSWSNILSLDLEITLTQSTKIGIIRDHGNSFLRYSIYGWGVPAILVILVVSISLSTTLPIQYGNEFVCWLLYENALLLTFALPVAIAIILNCILLCRAIYFVWKVGKLVQNANIVKDQKVQTFLYVKLVLLMGLTWGFGFIGTILRSSILMYVFTILNALQGVYVFMAFAANKRVLLYYVGLINSRFRSNKYSSSAKSTAATTTTASKLSSH